MNIQEDLQALHNHETFARFIKTIHDLREETISEMHEASSDTIQQVSGRKKGETLQKNNKRKRK